MEDFFEGVDEALTTEPSSSGDSSSLLALARELVQALEPETLLPAVADAVRRVAGGERVLILCQDAPGSYRQTFHRDSSGRDLPTPARFFRHAVDACLASDDVVFSYLPHADSRWAIIDALPDVVGFCALPVKTEHATPLVIYTEGEKKFAAGLSESAREVLRLLAAHTALALDNARALAAAAVDPHSQIHHPVFFARRLHEECVRSVRYRRNLSLALVAVDRADSVWQALGNKSDTLAQSLGERVQKNVRQADVVAMAGPASFFVLMPETPKGESFDPMPLHAFAARLHADIAERPLLAGIDAAPALDVRVAIVSHVLPIELSAEALRRDVEETLTAANARGEDTFIRR